MIVASNCFPELDHMKLNGSNSSSSSDRRSDIAVMLDLFLLHRVLTLFNSRIGLPVIPWPYVFENYVKAIFKRQTKREALSL